MSRPILLVEDNPDDEALTLRAFRKHQISNPIVVAHDGVEALDYLFGTGAHAGRDTAEQPQVVLLRMRADERTRLQPVVVLTSSMEERDRLESYQLGCNSYVRKPVDFDEFLDAVRQLGLYWLLMNEPPPRA